MPVRAITPAHIRSFKTTLFATTGRTGGTLSPATVKKALGGLGSVLSWAQREGYLAANPAEHHHGGGQGRSALVDSMLAKPLFYLLKRVADRKHVSGLLRQGVALKAGGEPIGFPDL